MLSADNEGIASRSWEGLERVMTVIVTACSAFGLTVPEVKTEIMCLKPKAGGICRSRSMQPARYTNKPTRVCVLGRGYHRRQRPQYWNNAASSEGLGVLPAVQNGRI